MSEARSPRSGSDWSETEVQRCVEEYFKHLRMDILGLRFNKEALYRALAAEIGRSSASVSMKFQNISAILDIAGREHIRGLSPLFNYQARLAEAVAPRIAHIDALPLASPEAGPAKGMSEPHSLLLEPPPVPQADRDKLRAAMHEFVQKFDPVERDARNRALGEAGEELVLLHEQEVLRLKGRPDLAENVKWISREEGDGAGYDILSFDGWGEKKFVEVKTTTGGPATPFYLSRNELRFNESRFEKYSLVRVFDFRRGPRAFEIKGRLAGQLDLSPESYRASLLAGSE